MKRFLNFKFLLLFSFMTSFISIVTAQNGTIKGKIIDSETKESLIGASVKISGTSNGTATDFDGNYVISQLKPGNYSLSISYISYKTQTKTNIVVEAGKETAADIMLEPADITLNEIQVVAKSNRESENVLLLEQKKALIATQAVGAKEMTRKGISNAEAAVTQVSGISKQEGVKNVFVRGLGDRYNATTLNGFSIPSEDPEYKNIDLGFFGTDIIQNIGVNKVFSANGTGDVGGAVIDITSKELIGNRELGFEISTGMNSSAFQTNFLKLDGVNYLGFANAAKPTDGTYNFPNSLDPKIIKLPLNQSFSLSGGKSFLLGENKNPLSFYVVASHGTDYSYTKELIKNTTTNGTIWQDQTGQRFSQNTNQLILANVDLGLNKHHLGYNFMMVHANNQYIGKYRGYNSERHQDSESYMGALTRQQTNDNLLFVNQISSNWSLNKKTTFEAGISHNMITGLEPDRRENYLSMENDGTYFLTGSNRQKRFFSKLKENGLNAKLGAKYKLNDHFDNTNSYLRVGYNGKFINDDFTAVEYNFGAVPGYYSIDNLKLDELYNQSNFEQNKFTMTKGEPNAYQVNKFIHSGYAEATYQLLKKLTGNIGLRYDRVDMTVDYQVQHTNPGSVALRRNYVLPSINLKYDINPKQILRLGASKTYTLPQSKEISPYQYVNISFVSQGNKNIKPSENYNFDLKWEFYPSNSELISLNGFYKYILKPIARVDEGNSAGLLTYDNVSDHALATGLELELRKNIFNSFNTEQEKINKLSIGLNSSYIYTDMIVNVTNTAKRHDQLEGASPFLLNFDVSYNSQNKNKNLTSSIILNYFSRRIHTIGAQTFKNINEEGVLTLDFVTSYNFNKNTSLKLNASNLLNPSYRLTREVTGASNENIILNDYKKGINISLGFVYKL